MKQIVGLGYENTRFKNEYNYTTYLKKEDEVKNRNWSVNVLHAYTSNPRETAYRATQV